MSNVKVRLTYDPTGRNPDNLIGSEVHDLKTINGFPYKIVTMEHGGFYTQSLRVYDASYKKLTPGTDYIVTYRYANISQRLGLNICSDVVFLNPNRIGNVFLTAQMVGGDIAFSLTTVDDYVDWFNQQPVGYVPRDDDYNGNEPLWKPGELDKERWKLDTFEPFNNEIYAMSRAIAGATGPYEQEFRDKVKADYDAFLDLFNDRLQRHIDDKANPHVDTKADVGLNLVENYLLATEAGARTGTANDHYLSPLLSWATVDQLALMPLNAHVGNRSNPHQTTPEKINAPKKPVVDAAAAGKYLRNETVANTNYFTDGTNDYTYSEYYALARRNIPAGNFLFGGANGYVDPRRIGRGSPSANTALNGDGNWVTWDSIIIQHGAPPSPQIFPVGSWPSAAAGHQFVVSQPWAFSAPVGSIAFYRVSTRYHWGAGNGSFYNSFPIVFGSYKSASGWIQL